MSQLDSELPEGTVILSRRLAPGQFLAAVRFLSIIRYGSFVAYHFFALASTVGFTYSAYVVASGRGRESVPSFVASLVSSGCYAWLRKLAGAEEQAIAQQQERELQMLRFHAEEDQRQKDNATRADLLQKLDTLLPVKSREKIIADCLGRLQPGQLRVRKAGGGR